MTDLTQAIAEIRRVTPLNSPWEAGDIGVGSSPVDYHIATILNAVASGDMIPLADHKLAVAMVVEKAAQSGYVACAETRHVSLGNKVRDTICALIPDDALAEVQALRAERDDLRAAIFGSRDYWPDLRNGNFIEMAATLHAARKGALARAEAAEAELAATQAKLARAVEGAQFARNRLEVIADEGWHGDGRDLKRSIIGVFSDFDAALEGAKP